MSPRSNILLITADDLNWDSVGAYGCQVHNITPNIDALAAQGVCFHRAHVTSAVCMPSRSVLATGRYPHKNGIEGFRSTYREGTPSIMELLSASGYRCGILGKLHHSSFGYDQRWDFMQDMDDLDRGRDPKLYEKALQRFFSENSEAPFYMMVNCHDPHRPFFGSEQEAKAWKEPTPTPSHVYTADEVYIPGFLPDLPEVRLEIAEYFSSVKRCDDAVGKIMAALEASGQAENTLVCFLSDNGMAFPFSKTNCYLHSTKTPWIAKLPGGLCGTEDHQHFISGIDWLPTVCELTGIDIPEGTDGKSFLPLLQGKTQTDRDTVYTQFNETSGVKRYPMRCIQNHRFGYIFNAWSNGSRVFKNESQAGRSFKAMEMAAQHDQAIAQRVDLFIHRVPEELYDFVSDPDALHNLIEDPAYADIVNDLRNRLKTQLRATGDWAAELFNLRNNPKALDSAIVVMQAEADEDKIRPKGIARAHQ